MKYLLRSFGSVRVIAPCLAAAALVACSADGPTDDSGSGGTSPTGVSGSTGSGSSGGSAPLTGIGQPSGGSASAGTGSSAGGTGHAGSGSGSGGVVNGGGGHAGTFGFPGGTPGSGGSGSGGSASGGSGGSSSGSAGSSTTGGGSTTDPCTVTDMPSGGTKHASNNQSGKAAGLDWTIWSNTNAGSITTFDVPAFRAEWNNAGDYLARIGLQWNASKTYDQYGTITAQFNHKRTGTGGGYSYIGVYGWSVSPCVEWYIVDDSFNNMPVNPGNTTNKGTAMIDGGKYTLYTRNTTGTGGSKCPGTSSWIQFYSVRQTSRACGQISITQHFDAWKAAGMDLGKMDQAQLLVEVGGGSGSVDFPVASMTASMP